MNTAGETKAGTWRDDAPAPAIAVAHALPGRTRLRTRRPLLAAPLAEQLADALAGMPGVRRVAVDRRTGGVLVDHDASVAPAALIDRARGVLEAAPALGQTRAVPVDPSGPPTVARELTRLFRDLDSSVRRATDGKLDLSTAAAMTFLGAGVIEVLGAGKIPAPPWFNLAWWGFRTFRIAHEGNQEGDALAANATTNEEKKP